MALLRMRRAQPVDAKYASQVCIHQAFFVLDRLLTICQHDAFRSQFGRKGYSKQVPPAPLHKEFIELGKTHKGGMGVDTMIMIDVSG
jgi:hypothetical protein